VRGGRAASQAPPSSGASLPSFPSVQRFQSSEVLFSQCLWRAKPITIGAFAFRFHDYGLGRLHIHELVLICPPASSKILTIFQGNLYYTAEITEITKTNHPQIFTDFRRFFKGKNQDRADTTDGAKRFLAKIDENIEADDLHGAFKMRETITNRATHKASVTNNQIISWAYHSPFSVFSYGP
jgi:hypothetical protein